jgi:hypothetical protein
MPAEMPPIRESELNPMCAYFATAEMASLRMFYATATKTQTSIAWNPNTGDFKNNSMDDNSYLHTSFNNNRQFIHLQQSFTQCLDQNLSVFEGQNNYVLDEKMRLSADALLNYCPDKISLQVTDEGSIFYTLSKDELSIYFQHFLIDDQDGSDEAIITVYKGEENILNYGGSLVDTLGMMNSILTPESFAVLELS